MPKSHSYSTHLREVADLYGRRRVVTCVRAADGYRFPAVDLSEVFGDCEPPDESVAADRHHNQPTHDQDHRTAHYLRILLDAYRPVLTAKQFEAVEQVIVLGRSLRELAAERGGSAEAWRQRLEGTKGQGGIKDKAPALYAIWLMRNRGRRDISEVINAIHRATAHHAAKPIHDFAPSTETK
jgi:hypothetical protein